MDKLMLYRVVSGGGIVAECEEKAAALLAAYEHNTRTGQGWTLWSVTREGAGQEAAILLGGQPGRLDFQQAAAEQP